MAGGALITLVAYGAQDLYLTGSPQVTFFKVMYRRHTNFAMESVEQVFNGQADFGKRVTVTISRNGDLINRLYVCTSLPDVYVPAATTTKSYGFRWLDWFAHILINYVDIEIGGQRIDRHYGEWMHIWNELTQTAGHQQGYANMVGMTPDLTFPKITFSDSSTPDASAVVAGKSLYIPLEFWFCRNPGLALPLIAMQYHEIKINMQFAPASDCYWAGSSEDQGATWSSIVPGSQSWLPGASGANGLLSTTLYADYVYLDTEERKKFAQVSHEYLITQTQFTGAETATGVSSKIKMSFNHPCKAIYWTNQPTAWISEETAPTNVAQYKFGKQFFNYTDAIDTTYSSLVARSLPFGATAAPSALNAYFSRAGSQGGTNIMGSVSPGATGSDTVVSARIQLNGHDRFSDRDGRYFSLVQPYQHHENVPSKGIYVYSFALRPEEHQPSGTCNMSRIDNATLMQTLTSASVVNKSTAVKIYAINYNILRVMSGMCGLAYAS